MIEVYWGVALDVRHVVIDRGAAKDVLCGFTGTPSAPGLPCDDCLRELFTLVDSALPLLPAEEVGEPTDVAV